MFGNTSISRIAVAVGIVSLAAGALAQLSRPTFSPVQIADRPVDVNRQVSRTQITTDSMFPQISETRGGRGVRPENPRIELTSGPILPAQPVVDAPGQTTTTPDVRFPGISFTGSFPPDTHIAVGDRFIVMVVNSAIAFFDKNTGRKVFQRNLDRRGFLSGVPGVGDFIFDPKVFYDPVRRRYYVVVLDVDFQTERSAFIVMGSDDGDPRGVWNIVRIDNTGQNFDGEWGDYPGWGFSSTHLAASFNMFPFQNGGVYTRVIGMPWSAVDSGTGQISGLDIGGGVFTLQMARSDGQNQDLWGVARSGNNAVQAIRLVPNGNTFVRSSFTVGITPFNNGPDLADANNILIDTINERIMDSFLRGNRLVAAWTASAPNPNFSAIRWAELRINSPTSVTLAGQGQVNGGTNISLVQPGITINAKGDMAMVFTRCGPNQSPQVAVAAKAATDPSPNFGPVQILATVPAARGFGQSSRWGDYAGIQADPTNPNRVWAAHQVFTAGNGLWSTRIASFILNSPVAGNLQGISTLYGTYLSGNLASVQAANDNNTYQVASTFQTDDGHYAGVEVVATTNDSDPQNNTESIQFDVRAAVTGENTPFFAYALNVRTNTWVALTTGRLTSTQSDFRFATQVPTSDYVNGSGQVRLRLVASRSVRGSRVTPTAFNLLIDRVTVTSNPFRK